MKNFTFKHFSLKKNGAFLGFGTSPDRDWKIMFSTFLILMFLILCFSAGIFVMVGNGDIFTFSTPTPANTSTFNSALLHKTALYYQAKEAAFNTIKASPDTTPDPSL